MPIFIGQGKGKLKHFLEPGMYFHFHHQCLQNKSVSLNTMILKISEKVLMKLCWMPRLLIPDNPESTTKSGKEKSILMWVVVRYYADGSDRSSRIIHGWCINLSCMWIGSASTTGWTHGASEQERERVFLPPLSVKQ